MSNNNKTIQKNRVMGYFVNAADEILSSPGAEPITARNVATRAGYNVATLYNYFSNLNHLVLFTSVKYLHAYAKDLFLLVQSNLKPADYYVSAWELFCRHSFENPDKFHSIFFGEFSNEVVADTIKTCSEVFTESSNDNFIDYIPLLKLSDLYERDLLVLKDLTKENPSLNEEDTLKISQMIILIYQSMIYNLMSEKCNYTKEEALNKMMNYIVQILYSYNLLEVNKYEEL